MKISLKDIYLEFFLVGLQLLGGGYVIVPLLKQSVIDKKKWIKDEELTDFYAISQTIPGIVAANVSTFVGYKLRGFIGAVVALLGIITSPIITILVLASAIDFILQLSFIKSIFWGVNIAVVVLIYLTIKEMWKYSISDIMSWVIFLFCLVMSLFFKVSPVIIIILAVMVGVFYKMIQERVKR